MGEKFKLQLLEAFAALITAAFGLVAALAWNEAIKTTIAEIFQGDGDLIGLYVYAILVTVLAVAMTILISRAVSKTKAVLNAVDEE